MVCKFACFSLQLWTRYPQKRQIKGYSLELSISPCPLREHKEAAPQWGIATEMFTYVGSPHDCFVFFFSFTIHVPSKWIGLKTLSALTWTTARVLQCSSGDYLRSEVLTGSWWRSMRIACAITITWWRREVTIKQL